MANTLEYHKSSFILYTLKNAATVLVYTMLLAVSVNKSSLQFCTGIELVLAVVVIQLSVLYTLKMQQLYE